MTEKSGVSQSVCRAEHSLVRAGVDDGAIMEFKNRSILESPTKRPRTACDGRGHGTERVISMQDKPIAAERFREYAIEQLELALGALNDPDGIIDDAVIGGELALMSMKMWLGEQESVTLGPTDLLEYLAEPECICPPDLVARGGFRGGCPVHG